MEREKRDDQIIFRNVATGEIIRADRKDIVTRENLHELMHKNLDGQEPSHEMLKQICLYMDFVLGLNDFSAVFAFYYELKRIIFDNARTVQELNADATLPAPRVND